MRGWGLLLERQALRETVGEIAPAQRLAVEVVVEVEVMVLSHLVILPE
jgi:hypothetical protein